MRTILLAAASFGLLTTAALADDAQTATLTSQPARATSIPDAQHYAANDGNVVCLHRVHEGELTNAVDCRNSIGWERSRRETQMTLQMIQMKSLLINQR